MGTITINSISFAECAGNSLFIETLYPDGLGEVLIGQFGLDQGRFSVNVHVYTEPAKKVPKWGEWGKNYNAVVLEFLGHGLKEIVVDNWDSFSKAELLLGREGKLFSVSQRGKSWQFKVVFGVLAFQRGSTYVDGKV